MASLMLRKQAFVDIMASCLEVYKKEAYGLIIGTKWGKNFIVKQALTFQSAKRHYHYTTVNVSREKRIKYVLKYCSKNKVLGDYHSHSNMYPRLSQYDRKALMESEAGFVSLLVSVKKSKRHEKWAHNSSDKSISGSLGDQYIAKIKAYTYNSDKSRIEKLYIKCPHLKTVDNLNKYYEKLKLKMLHLEKKTRTHRKEKKEIKKLLLF
ncbi:MAG: Mov34/MPN/PAD-1 family protein [archaeon]